MKKKKNLNDTRSAVSTCNKKSSNWTRYIRKIPSQQILTVLHFHIFLQPLSLNEGPIFEINCVLLFVFSQPSNDDFHYPNRWQSRTEYFTLGELALHIWKRISKDPFLGFKIRLVLIQGSLLCSIILYITKGRNYAFMLSAIEFQ